MVGRAMRGYGAGKKINGRKGTHRGRHPRPAGDGPGDARGHERDRDAGRGLLWRLRLARPRLVQVFAGRAFAGRLVGWAEDFLDLRLRAVFRPGNAKGFVVIPRCWKAGRMLGWLMKARRNVRGYECLLECAEVHLAWSLITLMARRLARGDRPRTGHWGRMQHASG
ncbi:hypothetical protein GCM10010214_61990 [Streptomyces abikoensis]|nr:hypothetical protein GCM10010214_61990 [Streptomyces abikoensis]